MGEVCYLDSTTKCDIKAIRYCQSGRKHDFKGFCGIVINGKTLTADEDANYVAYVCNLSKEKSRTVISNSDVNHAKIVLADLLRSAKRSVKIYCSEQDVEFFNQPDSSLRRVFHEFLADLQSRQVEVLLDGCSDTSIGMLKKLSIPKQIKIKVISPESRRQMKFDMGTENNFHMLIVDDESYRYEYDTAKHAAICSFNDRLQCKQMESAFNRAFRVSVQLH